MIEIYQPRWHDRRVLIATYKVSSGVNYIKFTKSPTLKGVFEITGDEIRKCPRETNGTIDCYSVPLSEFRQKQT